MYLLSNFIEGVMMDYIVALLAMTIIGVAFIRGARFVQIMSIIFLSLGVLMLYFSQVTWEQYILSFGGMLNLLTLFALIPILALPIQLGNYALGIQHIIQRKIKKSGQLYIMTSGLSYIFSCFMNLATLPMAYYSIRPSLDLFRIKFKEKFMSRSITHGYSMPLIWTPVAPIVGIVVDMNNVTWVSMLPILIPISLLGLCLDWLTGLWLSSKRGKSLPVLSEEELEQGRQEALQELNKKNASKKPGKVMQVLLAVLIFNVIVSVIEFQFDLSFLFLISALVIPYALIWSLLLRSGKQFFDGLKDHFQSHLIKLKDQFILFLSAGFFIATINVSGIDQIINTNLLHVQSVIGEGFFLILLPFVPFVLAFIGLHPVVAIALVAEALNPELLGIPSPLIIVALLGGATAAFLMGPYNATLGLMSNIVNVAPFRISNWNFPFTLIYLTLLIAILVLLQLFW